MIIGITGTLGAGKGTISDYLIEKKGYKHYSVSGYITQEVQKRRLEVNRDSMYQVGRDLKKQNGADFIVMELYKTAKQEGNNAIIESIRSPGEVDGLKELDDFMLLSVDADIKIRYDRIKLRASSKDNVSYETFVANNERERDSDSTDPTKINLSKCVALADFQINNDGSFEELYAQINKALN